jgi:hypothetical protein
MHVHTILRQVCIEVLVLQYVAEAAFQNHATRTLNVSRDKMFIEL